MGNASQISSTGWAIPPARPLSYIPEPFREFLGRLPAVVYECGPAPSFATTFVSDNVEAQFGYTPDEFYADPYFWTKRIHDHDRSMVLKALANIGSQRVITYEYRFYRRDGEYSWLHDQVTVVRDKRSNIVGLVGSWFDLTDRKRVEMLQSGQTLILDFLVKRRSLEESLEQIAHMIENQNTDMVCSILRYDPATRRLRHGAAPSLPDEYNRAIDGAMIGPNVGSCGTAAYFRKRVIVRDIRTDPLWADFRELGASINMRACWSQPILSSTGELLGTFAMYYPQPCEPTQADLELIEQAASLVAIAIERYHQDEMMRHTERLASLGTLAAGIAHEINNPLAGIQLAAHNALSGLEKENPQRIRSMLDLILSDTERCARIVRGVLQFGKRQEPVKQRMAISDVLNSVCGLTRGYALKQGATVDFAAGQPDAELIGCVVELEQVFVNVIRNAIESRERGARITIQSRREDGFVQVSISDNGRGMPADVKERMFEPFFTTRQSSGGTGLGMSIVHGIVVGHGGTISVNSVPGTGTTVMIRLPRLH